VHYVNLGATGLRVSRVCLGMMSFGTHPERPWALSEADSEPIIRRAVEGGITFFDTADVYNGGLSEIITGRVLAQLLSREELVIATKVHGRSMPGENGLGLSRKHVMASIDASLQRLGMDYVDLYQIHRWDPLTPIAETMDALHDVVKAGKARYIGASSMYAWQFAKAQAAAERHGTTRFASMQDHYNLVYREEEREMIPQCIDLGIAVLPWSPLARGWLAGTRTRAGDRLTARAARDENDISDGDFDVIERLHEVAAERGAPSAQVALAWLLARPGVTAPIVGATKVAHVEDALAAVELELTPREVARLDELYVPHAVFGHE
jgi:aryl-alcohol dehydrogenase-like predicted oxidoreductase